jgi:hypothetical protein
MASQPKTLILVGNYREKNISDSTAVLKNVEVWGIPAMQPVGGVYNIIAAQPTDVEYRFIENGKLILLDINKFELDSTSPSVNPIDGYQARTTPDGKLIDAPKTENKGFLTKLFGSDDDHKDCSCKDAKDASKMAPCPCKGVSGKKIAAGVVIFIGICLVVYFIYPTFAADKGLAA